MKNVVVALSSAFHTVKPVVLHEVTPGALLCAVVVAEAAETTATLNVVSEMLPLIEL